MPSEPSPISDPESEEDAGAGPTSPLSRLLGRFPALARIRTRSRRQIPLVQQATVADCGAACLSMVLGFYGKSVRLEEVRTAAGIDHRGTDALTLLKAARWFGLRGRGVKIDSVEDLRYLPKASVLHWGFHHFVVFERWTAKGAHLVDPASGRRFVGNEELRRKVTGVALTFEPGEDFETEGRGHNAVLHHLRRILGQRGVLSRILVASVLLQILVLGLPLFTGLLVDRVIPRGDYQLLMVAAVGLAGIVVFHYLSSLIRAHFLLQLRTQLDAQMTLDFLDHLVDLPYPYFQQRSAGDLLMRLNSNTTIREILTTASLSGLLDGTLVLFYLVVIFVISPLMGGVVLALASIRVLVFLFTRRKQRDLMSEFLQAQATSRSYQVQILAGIETLKATGTEKRSVDLWSHLFVDELNSGLRRGRLNASVDSLLGTLGVASPMVILVAGGFLVLGGHLSLGTMLAVNALAFSFLTPVTTLVVTALQLQLMMSYIERLSDVLETEKEQPDRSGLQSPVLQGQVSLNQVSFRYNPISPLIIEEISLDIRPGQFVAIVGQSGSGKSTLAHLILGLLQPSSGRVAFDGIESERLDLRSVRSQLGIVNQNLYLFGTSVRNNIGLVDPALPLEKIVHAAQQAQVHEDIEAMPMGYDTVLSDGGTSLSGGQRQRLALARALVSRPAILLLDEATSALDTITEAKIHRRLAELHSTRIVIAHRLSTIREADLIVVLDQGRLVESGRHEELLARGGQYSRLVETQLEAPQEATVLGRSPEPT